MDGTTRAPVEQLRIALVLNGGVSLAIWMGGAAHEINRLTRKDSHYERLLEWTGSQARVDVISGTSAGGINGAALAVAQCNGSPLAPGLEVLRGVWVEAGSFAALLRTPYRDGPPSLLQGDEYFLPQINQALRRLTAPFDANDPSDHPVDLTITTTLLRGVPGATVDSVGNRVARMRHDGLFRFRRGPTASGGTDAFAAQSLLAPGGTLDALALAARSTASYPVAFEPSFISMAQHDALHPAMAPYVAGAWTDTEPIDRFVIDGGVLANTPTHPALEAIDAMPASGRVRRVMLLVHPHAPAPGASMHQSATDQPSLVDLASGVLGALTSQGSRNYAEEIATHNRVAGGRHLLRSEVVALTPHALADQAQQAYHPWYLSIRSRRLARDLSELWLDHVTRHSETPTIETTFQATFETVLAALTDTTGILAVPTDPWPVSQPSALGFEASLGVADAAADYLRREVSSGADSIREVEQARNAVGEYRNAILAQRRTLVVGLSDLSGDLSLDTWLAEVQSRLVDAQPALTAVLDAIAQQVADICARPAPDTDDVALGHYRRLLSWTEDGQPATAASVLAQLNRIQLLTYVISDEVTTGNSLPIDLVQLSYQTRHPFAPFSSTGAEKVAGDQLGRFSAFLKRSWRINDWTWGRLDASRVLCQMVLQPDRVHRYLTGVLGSTPTADAVTTVAEDLVASLGLDLAVIGLSPEQLTDEIAAVHQNPRQTLVVLPEVFAAALAIQVAREEFGELRRAINQDIDEGANKRSRGLSFVTRNGSRIDALEKAETLDGDGSQEWTLLQEFDLAGIGREPLSDEATSDRLISTATGAAANAVSVLDNPRSGLRALSPVTKGIRGASLLPYWAITGLSGGPVARALSLLGLGAGGVLLVLGLLGLGPAGGTALGVAVLLVVFAYSALRTGTVLHGVVLLLPVLPLVAYATQSNRDQAEESVAVLLTTLLLVAGVLLLGSLRQPLGSPLAWAGRSRHRRLTNGHLVAVGAVIALLAAVLLNPTVRTRLPDLSSVDLPALPLGVLGAVVILAAAAAGVWRAQTFGQSLRLVVETPSGWQQKDVEHPAGSAAGWAAAYGVALLVAVPLLMLALGEPWPAARVWQATLVGAAVLGVVLVGVVPWRLQHRTHRSLDDHAVDVLRAGGTAPKTALAAHGLNYARYLRIVDESTPGWNGVQLTARAAALLARASDGGANTG